MSVWVKRAWYSNAQTGKEAEEAKHKQIVRLGEQKEAKQNKQLQTGEDSVCLITSAHFQRSYQTPGSATHTHTHTHTHTRTHARKP